MIAAAAGDRARFDRAFFGHVGFVVRNAARALLLGLTDGRLARPTGAGSLGPMLGQLSRVSAAFALVSDVAMVTLGGQLKRREKLSGRLADVLAWLYLASAAAKRFWDEGQPALDGPFVRWACQHALHESQKALAGILDNLPNRLAARVVRAFVFPLGARSRPPSDALGAQVARALLEDREERLRLTRDIYVPREGEPGLGRLEAALDKAVDALVVEAKIRDAVRAGRLDRAPGEALVDLAFKEGIITEQDRERIRAADEARDEAIQVDAFDPQSYRSLGR
jgi:acyl-CoA dehydrogenase